jgi:hypothetical protein
MGNHRPHRILQWEFPTHLNLTIGIPKPHSLMMGIPGSHEISPWELPD